MEFSSNWALGLNRMFLVRMTSFFGLENGTASVKATTYFKSGIGKFSQIADFSLPKGEDILDVVEQLQIFFNSPSFRCKHPEAAAVWETEMSTLEENVAKIANLEFSTKDFINESEFGINNLHQVSPQWIDWIISIFRHTKIDDHTPIPLFKAYTRLARSWQSWASVNGMMAGDICSEASMRNDTIACIIDRKIGENHDIKDILPYVALLYYLLPGFIDDYSGSNNDINFVKTNALWGVSNIVTNKHAVNFEEAQLYFDVREDNARMPRWITTYMKDRISTTIRQDSFDNDNPTGKTELSALQKLILQIRLSQSDKRTSKSNHHKLGMQLHELLDSSDILSDPESAYFVGRLLTEYFSYRMSDEDKARFYGNIRQKAVDRIISGDYADADLFNYAAAYLEYLFTQNDMAAGRDITTYFRDDYSCLLSEEEDDEW